MKLIGTLNATGSSNTFDFINIPQTFTDLVIVGSIRNAANQLREGVGLAFNNTFSGYGNTTLYGDGSSVFSVIDTTYNQIGESNANTSTANIFNNFEVYVTNYRSLVNKSASGASVIENNATTSRITASSYLQTITEPVNQVTIFSNTSGGNWVVGSTVSLYGIVAGSDGIVTTS